MEKYKERIPIVFTTDRNYFRHVILSIYSLLTNSSREYKYCFLILSQEDFEEELAVMRSKLAGFDNYEIEIIKPEQQSLDLTAKIERYRTDVYYRRVPDILKDYDRCLYLDCDIVCVGDVSRIWREDISGYLLGAVEGHNFTLNEEKHRKRLEWDDKEDFFYVNSGVTLFNLAECRAFGLEEKCERLADKSYLYLDQDIINIICRGRIKGLDCSYNVRPYYGGWYDTFISTETELGRRIEKAIEDAVIIHYAAIDKPWLNPRVNFGDAWMEFALREDLKELFPEAIFFNENPQIVEFMDMRRLQAHERVSHKAEIKAQKQQIRELKSELKSTKRQLNNLEARLEKLKKTTSYKIGRVITYIPRKIKALL